MSDPVPTFGQICVEAINLAAGRQLCGPVSVRIIDSMLTEHLKTAPKGRVKAPSSPFGDRKAIPPSPELVWAYSASLGEPVVDGHAFCDFYASKGWKVGKTPMVDWQAAVRTWRKSGYSTKGGKKPSSPANDYRVF